MDPPSWYFREWFSHPPTYEADPATTRGAFGWAGSVTSSPPLLVFLAFFLNTIKIILSVVLI
jgi:hypothetical protein